MYRTNEDYFEILGFSIEELQGQDENTIRECVNKTYKTQFNQVNVGIHPLLKEKTREKCQELLLDAKDTLISPEKRKKHIADLRRREEGETGKVVGIDLGMTFSAIAHVDDHGDPEIVPNAESELITPSVILFEEGLVTVGTFAQANAVTVPEQVVEFVKREMGKSKEEFSREFDGWKYSAEELSALILRKLKQDAEAYLNTEITDAVITVPAYFRDAEREATRNAGKIAGLNVLQVLNEPTAAALAYGFDQLGKDQNVFVFDLGDETFDVTIVKVSESEIETIATQGDHRFGGKDWDDRIIKYVAKTFEDKHGENPLLDSHTKQDMQQRAVSAKKELSQRPSARIMCSYNGNTRVVELTREKFEELTDGLVRRCQALCDLALIEGNMEWDDIDTVLLAGGSTRMPMVRKMIANISGTKINPHEVNPEEVVAIGAAIQATRILLAQQRKIRLR